MREARNVDFTMLFHGESQFVRVIALGALPQHFPRQRIRRRFHDLAHFPINIFGVGHFDLVVFTAPIAHFLVSRQTRPLEGATAAKRTRVLLVCPDSPSSFWFVHIKLFYV